MRKYSNVTKCIAGCMHMTIYNYVPGQYVALWEEPSHCLPRLLSHVQARHGAPPDLRVGWLSLLTLTLFTSDLSLQHPPPFTSQNLKTTSWTRTWSYQILDSLPNWMMGRPWQVIVCRLGQCVCCVTVCSVTVWSVSLAFSPIVQCATVAESETSDVCCVTVMWMCCVMFGVHGATAELMGTPGYLAPKMLKVSVEYNAAG